MTTVHNTATTMHESPQPSSGATGDGDGDGDGAPPPSANGAPARTVATSPASGAAPRPAAGEGRREGDPATVPEGGAGEEGPARVADDGDGEEEIDFVAIELTSPRRDAPAPEPERTPASADAPDDPDDPAAPLAAYRDFSSTTAIAVAGDADADAGAPRAAMPAAPPLRPRRVLRHPLLTPLAKVPWGRIAAAAGSCDLLFNCKYSLRQVEDEVRWERRGRGTGAGGEDGEGDGDGGPGPTPRGDGYVGVSLGLLGEGDEGCREDEDEFVEMGMECCSMLDEEDEEDGEDDGGEGGSLREGTAGAERENAGTRAPEPGATPPRGLRSKEDREEASWKSSNPSLDMMVYRTMILE